MDIYCIYCEKALVATAGCLINILTFEQWQQVEKGGSITLDKMGHNWHTKCWEAFQKEYNDHLDSTDLN